MSTFFGVVKGKVNDYWKVDCGEHGIHYLLAGDFHGVSPQAGLTVTVSYVDRPWGAGYMASKLDPSEYLVEPSSDYDED